MSPFVQACVLCGDHKSFMHDPHMTACPTCGSPYCKRCYSSLPQVKVGLLRKDRQCPKCAQASGAARVPYSPYQPYQPQAQYPQPPQSVYVTMQQTKETIREVVKIPCGYCGALMEQTSQACGVCGAPSRR